MKQRKALIVASVGGFIDFEKNDIRLLKQQGYDVTVACSVDGWEQYLVDIDVEIVNIHFERNPLSLKNLQAMKEIKKLIYEGRYDLIHCHTPVASIITRLVAAKKRKSGVKVIYTAHGFHFYNGAPAKNWIIYYNAEKICSRFTDVLITINTEDYKLAKEKFYAQKVKYIPGVGVDVEKIRKQPSYLTKEQLGLKQDDVMILSVGELNTNKNHECVIRAINKIGNKNIHYYIAGVGDSEQYLLELADKLGLKNNFHLLGYRSDVIELDKTADVFCLPSYREGLSVALMEAIACGTKVACSDIRGNRDLAEKNDNVILFDPTDYIDCANKLEKIIKKSSIANDRILRFSRQTVEKNMQKIYEEVSI